MRNPCFTEPNYSALDFYKLFKKANNKKRIYKSRLSKSKEIIKELLYVMDELNQTGEPPDYSWELSQVEAESFLSKLEKG